MSIEHVDAPLGEIHLWPNWAVADAAARAALTVAATDVGKIAWQQDEDSFWLLKDDSPMTWVQLNLVGSLADDSLTNAKLANMAQATIKGRASGAGTGDPTDLTATQATAILNAVVGDSGAGGTKGLVPAPGAGDAAAGKFLKADGTFAVPPGTATGGSGGIGDVTGPASSVDSEIALFSGAGGKTIKRATGSGLVKATSGVYSTVTAPSGAVVGDTDTQTLTNKTLTSPVVNQINDSNGNEVVKYGSTASAVNEVTITNKATGNAPTVEATGGDTDIDLNLVSKGAGVVKANGSALATKNAEINAQTGTTYTLVASDNGKIVTCSNGSAITVTVPSGLGAGFNCLVIQIGAGQVTFSPSSTTINHRQSHTKIAGQYGIATLAAYASNAFALGGDTSS